MKLFQTAIAQQLLRIFNFKGQDNSIVEVDDKIQPTVNVTFPISVYAYLNSTATSAGASTIYTVPTGKKLHIRRLSISMSKDAACDVSNASVSIYVNAVGVSSQPRLLAMARKTLTAQEQNMSMTFEPGEVIVAGAIQTEAFSFAAGSAVRTFILHGHLA